MNPAHREGWPPSQAAVSAQAQEQPPQAQGQAPRPLGPYGPSSATQQAPSHASPAQAPGPVLPPPSGPGFYSSNAATAHNQSLPTLPGLTAQPPQMSPHQSSQRPPSSDAGAQNVQGHQGPSYSLPGINQTLQQQQHLASAEQANADRERELRERETREREILASHASRRPTEEEMAIKREEVENQYREREREQREREQAALQAHSAPMQIHQPVAVAPSTRTIHGPNGLLGQAGPLGGPNTLAPPIGAQNNAGPMYANQPAAHEQTTPRMQHAALHMPFSSK